MKSTIFASIAAVALATTLAACSDSTQDPGSSTGSNDSSVTRIDEPSGEGSSAEQSGEPQGDNKGGDSTTSSNSAGDIASVSVTAEDAIATATGQVSGQVTSISLERERNGWEYDVDVYDEAAGHEVEFTIDAMSGEIIRQENGDRDNEGAVDISVMSPDEAIEKALAEVNGEVHSWTLDSDDGRVEYDVEIHDGRDDVDVEIDVESGQVRVDR